MAKKKHNEPWLLITFIALAFVSGLFYVFLFPNETINLINQYWEYILPGLIAILAIVLGFRFSNTFKQKRKRKVEETRSRQIKLAEQLIWRGRYNLEAQKAQMVSDDDPASREKWQEYKHNYIRTKLYPVVSEQVVPINLASALIENMVSGNRFRSGGRLPTYGVTDLDDQF